MKGRLYIDGVDIWSEFKVAITDGGYNGLISAPNLKPIDYIDWLEEDGIEADLSNPVLDTKEFDMSFGCMDNDKKDDFIHFITTTPYHDFEFKEIEADRKLRLVSEQSKYTISTAQTFSLSFADDFPDKSLVKYVDVWGTEDGKIIMTEDEINAIIKDEVLALNSSSSKLGEKESSIDYYQQYYLDGIPFSAYGVTLLDGCYDEVTKIPSVKKNLLMNYRNKAGAKYDNSWVKFQAKDVTLKCCLRANSLKEFWNNYNSLIRALIQPHERKLHVVVANDTFSCFYKSCKTTFFTIIQDSVWYEFALTLTFTDFRPKKSYYVWGAENSRIIMTEDETNAIIK